MTHLAFTAPSFVLTFLRSRHNLGLEILALRQQLAVFKRHHPRPRLISRDRLFWVALHSLWERWSEALIIVKPETVVGSHRAGFRLYWRFRPGFHRLGRPKLDYFCVPAHPFFLIWSGRGDLNARPPAPKADFILARKGLFSTAYVSSGYGRPVEACGILLNPEAPGSYKIIYSAQSVKVGFRRTISLISEKNDKRLYSVTGALPGWPD